MGHRPAGHADHPAMRALATLLALALLGLSGAASGAVLGAAPPPAAEPPATLYLQNLYHEPDLFNDGAAAPARFTLPQGRLRAGMVPHHLLATDLIAGFFAQAQSQHLQQPYQGVLLVSPSHFPENCGSLVTTGRAGWSTHLGRIQPYETAIAAVLDDPVIAAEDNPQALEQDHGCAGLTPYIRAALPQVPLGVVLLSNKLSRQRLEAFWAVVERLAAENDLLVVASADCSHYLTPQEADLRDQQTTRAILEANLPGLLAMDDRNIDSPQAVTSFLQAAAATGSSVTLLGGARSDQRLPFAPQNPAYREGITSYLVFAAVETP